MTTRSTSTSSPSMKPFFLLWSGQALSLLGSQVAQFALIWWLTLETGSAKILTTATMFGLLPQILLGPVAGALIDRWNRQRILLVADSVIAAASLALAFFFWTGVATTWHVLTTLAIRALASAFHQPAMTASTSLMVPKQHLARIQGLNKSLEGLLLIASAPLGAVLLGVLSIPTILGLDVATALFAIVPLFFVHVPQPGHTGPQPGHSGPRPAHSSDEAEKPSVTRDILDGMRYLRSWPGLLVLVMMGALVNLFVAPITALLPLLITDHFGGSALQFASLMSVFGIGVITGGITLGIWGGFERRVVTSLCGLVGLGLSLAVLGLAPSSMYILALAGMFGFGFTVTMANGPMQAAMQAVVEPEYQGRVFTLLQTVALVAAPAGLMIAGPAADLLGVQACFLAAAAVCVLKAIIGLALPMTRNLEDRGRSAQTDRENPPEQGTIRPSMIKSLEET